MAHFAKLDQFNIVVAVLAGADSDNGKEDELCARTGDTYRQTSFNTRGGVHYGSGGYPDGGVPFRKNYAGIGYTYDSALDAFIPPQPFSSWTLNKDLCLWQPPVPYPVDWKEYFWAEPLLNWIPAKACTVADIPPLSSDLADPTIPA
jgi:hypothetical protein